MHVVRPKPKTGRPQSSLSEHFTRTNEMANSSLYWTVCNLCLAEYTERLGPTPERIRGRKDYWLKHLGQCPLYDGELAEGRREDDGVDAMPNKKLKQREYFTAAERQTLWRLILEFQAEAFLADSFIELPSARRLFK
ncbi:hypothetical protein PInf_019902 [Phytophthora infestans]|nr:hypothetical protein PInf_019902 [Phytophthora infestans]